MTEGSTFGTYLGSLLDGWSKRQLFRDVKYYCMFFGYPGSGHSLVGSIMDAHPQMVISHELDAMDFLRKGYRQNQLFSLILRRSAEFTQEGRQWTGHNYTVEGQWQGRFDQDLVVIGDKKGGWSSRYLETDSGMLDLLLRRIDKAIRYIHVTRNPFDNISTMTRRSGRPLQESIKIYFRRAEGVRMAKEMTEGDAWLDLRHEDVVANTEGAIREICDLFNLTCTQEYIQACAALVFPSPRKTREGQSWEKDLIKDVAERIQAYPFLHSYSYAE